MPQKNPLDSNGADLTSGKLPKPQRNAVILLSLAAILIVFFWFWQLKAQINGPFKAPSNPKNTESQVIDSISALQKSDVDSDGLSDYEEIYTYKTSPYLEDTDSDGILDKKEIENGTDPNCPEGKDCNALPENVASSTNNISSTTPDLIDTTGLSEEVLQQALGGVVDAATLRQLLLSAGVASQADLDQISDEALMKSYQETLANQENTGAATSTVQ